MFDKTFNSETFQSTFSCVFKYSMWWKQHLGTFISNYVKKLPITTNPSNYNPGLKLSIGK